MISFTNYDTGIISVTAIIIISLFQSDKTTEAVAQRPEACNFIKKETLAQAFTCKFFETFKNTFLTEHIRWLVLILD